MSIILNIESKEVDVYCIVEEQELNEFQKISTDNLLRGGEKKYTFYNNNSSTEIVPSVYITCMIKNKPTVLAWDTDEITTSKDLIVKLLREVYLVNIELSDVGNIGVIQNIDDEYKKNLNFFAKWESYFIPLGEGTENYTRVLMDVIYNYNAPSNFKLISVENRGQIGYIHMQEGPVKELGVNGWANEDLINIVITRLKSFNNSPYSSIYNTEAINHLRNAIDSLNARTKKRDDDGKLGTSKI